MCESNTSAVAPVNIDALLQTTWLKAIRLRNGLRINEGEGRPLWNGCVKDIVRVQRALKVARLDEINCQHILYAQCALLDEVVTSRGVEDDAFLQWRGIPLQKYFLGTTDAGDKLCDRMWKILRDPDAHRAVLTCFHRVLMLGFLGRYRALHDPERRRLAQALSERMGAFSLPQRPPVQAVAQRKEETSAWLASRSTRIKLGVILLGIVWLGCDYWLV